jgi:hypothetical protein
MFPRVSNKTFSPLFPGKDYWFAVLSSKHSCMYTVKVNTNYVHKCFCKSCLYSCRGQQDIQPETRNCFHNVIGISHLHGLHILPKVKRCTRSERCNGISSPTDVSPNEKSGTLWPGTPCLGLHRQRNASPRDISLGGQIIRGDQSSWHYSNLEFEHRI